MDLLTRICLLEYLVISHVAHSYSYLIRMLPLKETKLPMKYQGSSLGFESELPPPPSSLPLLLLTISMQKSGRWPVIPNTVVFKYFSWPARSIKVMTLEDFSQILVQSRLPPWLSGLLTTWPSWSNPRMSLPTLLVRPLSISCLCLKSFCRAKPRPLSSSPWVSTPSRVLLPASTFPTTATLRKTPSWLCVSNEKWL